MKYTVFYCFYDLDQDATSDDGIECEKDQLVEKLLDPISADEDFFGLVDSEGTTLQAMYDEEDDQFWLEIPSVEEQGSYGQYRSRDEIRALLSDPPAIFKVEDFPGFEFMSWE